MAIDLDQPKAAGLPVVKQQRIGEKFVGAIVRYQQRDKFKNGAPDLKENGKARQEMVITCLVMPGTTMQAGIGGTIGVPEAGDTVRVILYGGGFSQWIDAKNELGRGLVVGDTLTLTSEYGQEYVQQGNATAKKGGKLTTQAELDAVPRSSTLGVYGPLTITDGDPAWVAKAEAAHHETAKRITLDDTPANGAYRDEEPF